MKLWKTSILLIGVFGLVLSCLSVSAETQNDTTGDVYHWKLTEATWSWKPSADPKANIDITELTYTSSENQLTLSLKVTGSIQSSEQIAYIAWVNTSDAFYWLYWMDGQSSSMAMNTEEGSMQFDLEPNVTVSSNTITCTFNVVGTDGTASEFWGYTAEYTEFGDITKEWWGDWIPGTYAPFWGQNGDGDGDGNGDDGTPGFEAIAVIAAIALVFIILRRRK
jgi:hypothetical protein